MKVKNMTFYTDILGIISVLGIVGISVISTKWSAASVGSISWIFMTVMQSALRFAFPAVIMIAGIKYLSPTEAPTLKRLYSNDILKLFVALAFWSILYAVIDSFLLHNGSIVSCFKDVVIKTMASENHFWLIFGLIGLLIVSPLLKKIASDKKILEYFLIIWIVFTVIGNIIVSIPDPYINLEKRIETFEMSAAIHFSGYFCLGYYLDKYEIKKPVRILTYFLSALSIVAFVAVTYHFSVKDGKLVGVFLQNTLPMTVLIPSAFFLFAKNVFKKQTSPKSVAFIAKASFGVYLCHAVVLKAIERASLLPNDIHMVYQIIITTVVTYLISLIFSAILNCIPFVKKYIV